ncbi:MAG: hypothetical protein MUC54_01700 [Chloroflexi bacterium]|nr:hypothetical protein [Chloroflexota bacterium]
MDLAGKLQLRAGQRILVVHAPPGLALDLPTTTEPAAGPVLVFVRSAAELATLAGVVVDAALAGQAAWLAYPKGGQLGTDLNRDRIWRALLEHGIRPIRQVAIDETWSALRFRAT